MTDLLRVSSTEQGEGLVAELVSRLAGALGARRPALLLCFCPATMPLGAVLAALGEAYPGVATLGSTTAGQFTDAGEHAASAVVTALVGDYVVHASLAEGLRADVDGAAARAIDALPKRTEGYAFRTAILLFDGLAGVGEEVTLTCASLLGAEVPVAGAAAGDDWAIEGTLVGAAGRAAKDALAIAVIDSRVKLGIGVAHGHRAIGERLRVTRSTGNVVHEFDGVPAWERYAELTRKTSVPRDGIDPSDVKESGALLRFFTAYQTAYSVGEGEFKNRTALGKLADGSMSYACGIPEGSEFELLSSNPEAQVRSATAAAEKSVEALGGGRPAAALVFECACRKAYLGERFDAVPTAIVKALGGAPIAGFEAYGEVALNVGDFSGFHNATTVVLAFPAEGTP